MTHSKIHKLFSNYLEQPDALTNPGKYLGPNFEQVLDFWIYVDTLSVQEKEKIADLYLALDDDVRVSACVAARDAAEEVVGEDFSGAAWWAAVNVTGWFIFGDATLEFIGDVKTKLAYDLIMSHRKF